MADLTITVDDSQLSRIKAALTVNGVTPNNADVVTWVKGELNNRVRNYEEAVASNSVSGLGL